MAMHSAACSLRVCLNASKANTVKMRVALWRLRDG